MLLVAWMLFCAAGGYLIGGAPGVALAVMFSAFTGALVRYHTT